MHANVLRFPLLPFASTSRLHARRRIMGAKRKEGIAMIFNWLLITGLPFDPPPSEAAAKAAAATCRTKWASRANDQRRGPYYRTLLDQADEIEAALSDEREIKRLASEARAIAFPLMSTALRTAASGGRCMPRAKLESVARFVEKRIERTAGILDASITTDCLERCAASLGVVIDAGGGESDRAQRAYERFAKPNPAQDAAFKADVQLQLYGAADLYEFACPEGCTDPRSAVGDDLVKRAEELSGSFKQDKERKSTIETLAQKAKEVFGNREKRKRYDEYLRRRAAALALDELKDCAALSGGIVDADLAAQTTAALARILGPDAAEAPYVLEGFCRAQRPPLVLEKAMRNGAGQAASGAASAHAASSAAPSQARPAARNGEPTSPQNASSSKGSSGASSTSSASRSRAHGKSAAKTPTSGASGAATAKCDPVSIRGASVVNGDLVVRVDAPGAATGFVVLTRPDRFARSLTDTNPVGLQTRHEIPRSLLDRDGALVVPDARRLGCYVTVYAEYRAGGKVKHSKGCNWQVVPARACAVQYRVDARKAPFRAPRAQVTLVPPRGSSKLPDALVVCATGALPLTAEEGRLVARIPAQQATAPLRVELDGLPNERDLYVRVFAASGDPEAFVLEPGSFCKVS